MFEIKSLKDYEILADRVLSIYSHIPLWLFEGPLGAGKTTFIRHILSRAGVQDEISSPTFSIVNEYAGHNSESIYHLDCYRIKHIDEALQSGLDEILTSGRWCLVEWPRVVEPLFWGDALLITFEKSENCRRLQLEHKRYE